ncbi:hypothetical protein G5B30_14175 [Sphingobacterium sp. SGG-5]|uniref:hypothetical protein n=1 Tax=Sphingobacterium sp. SGG-5 TaxID=2710881 RepID=UPI0013EC7346|nr:hypothetical protein [Sphingobacterium sp. SGG-5]NGM63055.1 hypothetical protein [Sphingobacterium sp. SGG-5]
MKITRFCAVAIIFAMVACTKDKTDYEAEIATEVTEYVEFEEAARITVGDYDIGVEALNGTFYVGYNEVRVKVTDKQTGADMQVSSVTFLPIRKEEGGNTTSCPHRYDMNISTDENCFSGYAVFTDASRPGGNWELYISFTIDGQLYSVHQAITVEEQLNMNLNMTSFTGKDDEQYIIALVSPQRPKVGENELVAGIYRFEQPNSPPTSDFPDPSQFTYTEVSGYTLLLDPRMPEPSMGNHSSPNNVDLTQRDDGLYYGVVNYTMTGNWTLNFILQNEEGRILRGTEVPTVFTPGIEGVKSELYIDVLF